MRQLEAKLEWPPGTLALIDAAFAHNLTRKDGIEVSSGGAEAAARCAARVFRRGVAWRKGTESAPTESKQGRYAIDFVQVMPQPSADFRIVCGRVAKLWPSLAPADLVLTLDEHTKSLETVAVILDAWRKAGRPQRWSIVGGGIITDVAAFAASLANCAVTFVPTTLLAMADACVGGKTGVNVPLWGKNQLGTFYFPEHVLIWAGWLQTLPDRELKGGAAECLKHALLSGDMQGFAALAQAVASQNLAAIDLYAIVKLKVDVVSEDPVETGKRATLNFGHTLGHALESLSQENTSGDLTLTHGEAVGIGMAFATLLSVQVAGLEHDLADEILRGLHEAGCLTSPAELARRLGFKMLIQGEIWEQLTRRIETDKKRTAATPRRTADFVLLKKPGHCARNEEGGWTIPVDHDTLARVWLELISRLDFFSKR